MCLAEHNRTITPEEKESLIRYASIEHPFWLMFTIILRKKGLL